MILKIIKDVIILRLTNRSGNITYLGYTGLILTTIYTIIITILGLQTMLKVNYIYKTFQRSNRG